MKENELKIYDAIDFVHEQLPQSQPIIGGGILPQKSIQLIGGPSKIGKSILGLNEAFQIATAKPFLGFTIPHPKKVLYLQAEVSEHSMQNRLQKMLAAIDYDLPLGMLYIINQKNLKFTIKQDLKTLDGTIKELGIEVLIIDPLYKYHLGDENSSQAMTRVFDCFDWLIQGNNISIIVCHHFGKPVEGRSGATQFRGSSSITDYPDSYLMLTRHHKEDRNLVKVSFELRNAEEPEPMILHRDPCTLWYEMVDIESQKKAHVIDAVNCLKALGGSTGKRQNLLDALIDKTGASKRLVNDVLKDAETSGAILTKSMGGQGNPKLYYLPEVELKLRNEIEQNPNLFGANRLVQL